MTIDDLLARLEEDPENRELLSTLADQLASAHDVRGELIAAQLAGDDARRDAALAKLPLPVTLGVHDRVSWGIGFVRKLVLLSKNKERIAELEPLWTHASLRLLWELVITFKTGRGAYPVKQLAKLLPTSIRVLQLGKRDEMYIDDGVEIQVLEVAGKVAPTLPRLTTLVLEGPLLVATEKTLEALATGRMRMLKHPQLTTLSLGALSDGDLQGAVDGIAVADLPSLRHLTLRTAHPALVDRICATLAARDWLARIKHLSLLDVTLGDAGIAALEQGLGGRKLAQLDVTGVKLAKAQCERLAALCDKLIAPDVVGGPTHSDEVWVVHENKPEWGRGRVVRRFGDKIEVAFEGVGTKVFMANAKFLRTET